MRPFLIELPENAIGALEDRGYTHSELVELSDALFVYRWICEPTNLFEAELFDQKCTVFALRDIREASRFTKSSKHNHPKRVFNAIDLLIRKRVVHWRFSAHTSKVPQGRPRTVFAVDMEFLPPAVDADEFQRQWLTEIITSLPIVKKADLSDALVLLKPFTLKYDDGTEQRFEKGDLIVDEKLKTVVNANHQYAVPAIRGKDYSICPECEHQYKIERL